MSAKWSTKGATFSTTPSFSISYYGKVPTITTVPRHSFGTFVVPRKSGLVRIGCDVPWNRYSWLRTLTAIESLFMKLTIPKSARGRDKYVIQPLNLNRNTETFQNDGKALLLGMLDQNKFMDSALSMYKYDLCKARYWHGIYRTMA
jgi:hypothetical protein